MTKEAAVNLSYLYAAELLKEAAEEDGVDLDAEAQGMSDEDVAEMLDDAVVDLANAGELDAIYDEIDEDEPEANFGSYEDGETEVDEELEAEAGFFMAKTAALLDAAAEPEDALDRAAGIFEKLAARRSTMTVRQADGSMKTVPYKGVPEGKRGAVGGREGLKDVEAHFAKGRAKGAKNVGRIAKSDKAFKGNALSRAARWFAGKGGKGVNKLRVGGAIGGGVAALGAAGLAGHALANRRKNG